MKFWSLCICGRLAENLFMELHRVMLRAERRALCLSKRRSPWGSASITEGGGMVILLSHGPEIERVSTREWMKDLTSFEA